MLFSKDTQGCFKKKLIFIVTFRLLETLLIGRGFRRNLKRDLVHYCYTFLGEVLEDESMVLTHGTAMITPGRGSTYAQKWRSSIYMYLSPQ